MAYDVDRMACHCNTQLPRFNSKNSIFCAKHKNDQLSRGHTIYFARSGKITCPVCITEQLLAQLPKVPKQHLVCRLASNGRALQPALSYSRVREIFRETLSLFDSNWRDYGTHSLEKGGASVSSAVGMSCELLDKHAGWKCARSKESYRSYCVEEKLKVSRAINL